jgi:predicted alpha-1,2-mannosidase
MSSFVRQSLDYYHDCGWLPDGVAAGRFVPGMPSNFLGFMNAAAYARGIRDFNVNDAYEAAKKNELDWRNRPLGVGKFDLKDFIDFGYIPIDDDLRGWKFGASHTLEYSFSSWAVGQMAKYLGKTDYYKKLNALGLNYKNIFDPSIKFMRAKNGDGSFVNDFTPTQVWNGFQEGNSWQYTWYVPQDVNGLIKMMGKDTFLNRLDTIFTESVKQYFGGGRVIDAFSGLSSIYNQGNEPCMEIPYLYNYAGKPWLSQKWVREICNVFYGVEPLHGYGYGQDEDQGQLGSWFVMSAIGLFDVQGGAAEKPTFQIVTPMFDKITISLDTKYGKSKKFEIITKSNSKDDSRYIQSVKLNGKAINQPWFYQSDLFNGSKLEIKTSNKPNKKWGANPKDAPPSMSLK